MEGRMSELKQASNCWWFDSHNSARRSPWLQSTLSDLEKKTKGMLNLIEGDADSFAQRAEIYYRKRPELVNMIEDFYRSYRYLAEQHELLRSEVGSRRSTLFKCDSSIQSSPCRTWDSTDNSDYPESDVSEVDNLGQEEAVEIESTFMTAVEENDGIRRNLEAKLSEISLSFNSSSVAESEVQGDIQVEHQDETMLIMEVPPRKEHEQKLMVCPRNTESLMRSPLDLIYLESDNFSHNVCEETISRFETDDDEVDDHGNKMLYLKIVGDMLKLTSEVDVLKIEKGKLMAELQAKDEEKRHVIRQLSLTVDILKEENVRLKKFIMDSKRPDGVFEFKKLVDAFSRTVGLFGLSTKHHPSLVAL